MNQQTIDWQKVLKWFLGFAIARVLFDYFSIGSIDIYGVIGIPLIAIALIYLIDKKQFMKADS